MSRTTKHQNFGFGRPRSVGGGYQSAGSTKGAQAYANSFCSHNKAASKIMGKKQANTLGGSRAGG